MNFLGALEKERQAVLARTGGVGGSTLGFLLLIFGLSFLSSGLLIAIFAFQPCDLEDTRDCNAILKITGLSLGALGLGFILLSRSKIRVKASERQLGAAESSHYGPKAPVIRFLICICCSSGVLLTLVGVRVTSCPGAMENQALNSTSAFAEAGDCKLLFLQIMGPILTFVGICLLFISHVRRREDLAEREENTPIDEHQQSQGPASYQITMGNSVMIFRPTQNTSECPGDCYLATSERPPSYYSVVFHSCSFGTST
ncbi:transmembrane protein 171 [Callorhinchus milii]|uniref:transmembrane protein 171 n=1 Tax=Callorhinchus milii TaxID=7868 RepID=UPI001C3F6B63|nr:transmembrane protein 171 [Callorhinchus milii]